MLVSSVLWKRVVTNSRNNVLLTRQLSSISSTQQMGEEGNKVNNFVFNQSFTCHRESSKAWTTLDSTQSPSPPLKITLPNIVKRENELCQSTNTPGSTTTCGESWMSSPSMDLKERLNLMKRQTQMETMNDSFFLNSDLFFPSRNDTYVGVEEIEAMNRNARRAKKANKGARPCSRASRRRKKEQLGKRKR